MYDRLSEVDDLTRPDHYFVEVTDHCFYMGEYTARGGFAASDTNQLIANLKKPMDRRGRPEWQYKGRAITSIATDLNRIVGKNAIEALTFVPVPPSKARTDPLYDDRLLQILTKMAVGCNADIREMVVQRASMAASHESDERTSIEDLVANYELNPALLGAPREAVVVFDDMLTTGRHFKAVQHVLLRQFPGISIFGIFVARRVPQADFTALFGEEDL